MPKGQTPKPKGSIFNVLVDTNVENTLPQGADSNGILMVKLESKLQSWTLIM